MNPLTQLLLRALLTAISPGVAAAFNRWALRHLERFAATTETNLDEKLIEVLRRFLATDTGQEPRK